MTTRVLIATLAAGALVAAGCGSKSSAATERTQSTTAPAATRSAVAPAAHAAAKGPCGKAKHAPARYAHVVWIVMENHAYGDVIGSSEAPYENQLAKRCALATNFRAETHPSLPNYLAMTSGSTQGVSDDDPPSSHPLSAPSIFSQLGGGWRALQESMHSNCALANSADYAVRHNPATYFTNIRAACARQNVPLGASPNLSAKFTFVTPNLCNDTHDCSVSTGDRWLQTFMGKVFASRPYRARTMAVFLTWDEDDSGHGNHIATIVAAPAVKPGRTSGRAFTHYSMLRTTEQMLGLGFVGEAASAASMRRALGV